MRAWACFDRPAGQLGVGGLGGRRVVGLPAGARPRRPGSGDRRARRGCGSAGPAPATRSRRWCRRRCRPWRCPVPFSGSASWWAEHRDPHPEQRGDRPRCRTGGGSGRRRGGRRGRRRPAAARAGSSRSRSAPSVPARAKREAVVGAGPFPVLELGLGHRGAEVDVPQGGGLVLVGVAPRPRGGGSSAGRPAGPARRWWRRSGPSRPTARGSATAPRRPARPRRSAARRARRSSAARWRRAVRAVRPAVRSRGRRGARGRSGRRSSSAPGARWAGRCRPSPSGRRPPCPACAGSGPRCRCGCRRRRGRCAASPRPSAAGCRWRRPGHGRPSGRSGRSRRRTRRLTTSPPDPRGTAGRAPSAVQVERCPVRAQVTA